MPKFKVVNPDAPEEIDFYQDIPLVDPDTGMDQLDSDGNILVKRYVNHTVSLKGINEVKDALPAIKTNTKNLEELYQYAHTQSEAHQTAINNNASAIVDLQTSTSEMALDLETLTNKINGIQGIDIDDLKDYVYTQVPLIKNNYLPLVGGTITGSVTVEEGTITGSLTGIASNATADVNNKELTSYVADIMGANAQLSIIKGDGTTSVLSINNVLNATNATQDASGNNIVNTYATKSSLSSAQTTLQNNINLVIQRIDKHEGSSAGSANARYLEKDMTDYFNTGALSTDIANNNFSELSVGNSITKDVVVNGTTYSNVKFYLAHFDYYYTFGDIATTKHHVLILPATPLGTAAMDDTNTTEGGYLNSKMRKTTLPLYSAGYQSAFGSAHILGWRNLVTINVNKTAGSSGYTGALGASDQAQWVDAVCELMSESMVYGAPVWSSSGRDIGLLHQQLALFRFNTSAILANRIWYWLSNVHSSTDFCNCFGDGVAYAVGASAVYGVRPFALLI